MQNTRKKPFSGKQKREQLKEKRARKAEERAKREEEEQEGTQLKETRDFRERKRDAERYFIRFINLSTKEVEDNKLEGTKGFNAEWKKIDFNKLADPENQIPIFGRPPWIKGETKEAVDARETRDFEGYIGKLSVDVSSDTVFDKAGLDAKAPILGPESLEEHLEEQEHSDDEEKELEPKKEDTKEEEETKDIEARQNYNLPPDLSYFETNLNVIRQFWRAEERSQCVMLVADARFPIAHCPGNVLRYFGKKGINKPVIIVLNKADLCPEEHVSGWIKYLSDTYKKDDEKSEFTLVDVIPASSIEMLKTLTVRQQFTQHVVKTFRESLGLPAPNPLSICLVGQPSVGKSSLLNGILGRKVASTKQTPGLTKHFQTHFVPLDAYAIVGSNEGVDADGIQSKDNGLGDDAGDDKIISDDDDDESDWDTKGKGKGKGRGRGKGKGGWTGGKKKGEEAPQKKTVVPSMVKETDRTLCLCDSPGFVFPILGMPKPMQVICGVFPLSRTREFLSPTRDLVECFSGFRDAFMSDSAVNLPEFPHTPLAILEGIAEKRKFHLRGGRLDTHRAGMLLLNRVINGQITYLAAIPREGDETK